MALLLAQARNIPQAHSALVAGRWERSKWEGVELHGKVLGVVGLGRAGSLVAQRAHAFGMELIGFDPFVSQERARAMGVRLVSIEELVAEADFVSIHTPKTPETIGLFGRDLFRQGQAGHPHREHGPRRHRRRGRAGRGHPRRHRGRGRSRRVRQGALHRVAAVRAAAGRRLAAPGRVDRGGAGQGRRHHRRAGAAGAGRRLRPLRRQRGGARRLGHGARLHGTGRAAGPLLRRPARRAARRHRHGVPGRAGGGGHGHPHAVGAEGDLRRLHRGAGVLRQRAAAGRAARPAGARVLDRDVTRLQVAHHPALGLALGRRHADHRRPAHRAAHRHRRRPPGGGPAVGTTCSSCATTTGRA